MARAQIIRFRVTNSRWNLSDFDPDGRFRPRRTIAKDGPCLGFDGGVHEIDVDGNAALKQAVLDGAAAGCGVDLIDPED